MDYFETRPILVNKDMVIFAGNMRYRAAKELGIPNVPVAVMDISEERQLELMFKDNHSNGQWDLNQLVNWDTSKLINWGFDQKQFFPKAEENKGSGNGEGSELGQAGEPKYVICPNCQNTFIPTKDE